MAKEKQRLLPSWVFKLMGISSLATAVISFAIYWFKKYPPRRRIGNEEDTSDQLPRIDEGWSLNSIVKKKRKKMTISLKNTVLWNPSPDLDTPMYGFAENSTQLLTRLNYTYDIYVIVHVNSTDQKQNIQQLLDNAKVFKEHIDSRKIIYCSNEEGKIHIIRHIEPFIHVEGGWEKDDGEDMVKKLKPFVNKIIWLVTKRRRDSFRVENIKEEDRQLLGHSIEIAESLMNTTIAKEVKF